MWLLVREACQNEPRQKCWINQSSSHPTHVKVANQHTQSKAIAKEKALWNLAEKEVIPFEDYEPIDENNNTKDIDEEIEVNMDGGMAPGVAPIVFSA